MQAVIVIKTANGYAALPFKGDIPADSLADLRVATNIGHSYASGSIALSDVLEDYFEPPEVPEVTSIKAVA